MTEYVLGFMFSENGKNLALIRKEKPEWQAGFLNGIGGHIESGESPIAAMNREFYEETGVFPVGYDWQQFLVMENDHWKVYVFKSFSEVVYQARTKTKETVYVGNIQDLLQHACINNLHWLIPMALDNCPQQKNNYSFNGVIINEEA